MKYTLLILGLLTSTLGQSQSSNWSSSPRQFPGMLSADLTVDQLQTLSTLLMFPPQEDSLSLSFSESMVLDPISFDRAILTSQNDIEIDVQKVKRARDAFKSIEHFNRFPALEAYEHQISIIKYYQDLMITSAPADRDDLQLRLSDAQKIQEDYRENLKHQSPDEIQAAILRRAHRDLSYSGFPVPDLQTFLSEWPLWLANFANTDYLKVRLHLATGLSSRSREFLTHFQPKFPDFHFRIPEIVKVVVTNNTGLKDTELMSRAHIEQLSPDNFDLVFSLTFFGVESLFQPTPQDTHIPYDLGIMAVSEGRTLNLDSMATQLCLRSFLLPEGAYVVKACGVN